MNLLRQTSLSFFTTSVCLFTSLGATTPVVLDPVNVTASPDSLTTASAESARADVALTPGGVEVVDADRYMSGRASTLSDTFFLSPGVFAQSRFGSDEARLSIRGSGLQRTFHGRGVRVLQDGVPVNLADGGFDMQSLEPAATSHIVVWRGGNALALGSSTLGGAVDYVSRNGRTDPGGFARLELGSWNYLRATLAGGTSRDAADGYASFTEQSQDGFRDHAEQHNQRLFTNAGWRFSDTLETRLYLSAVQSRSELPGNLTKAELEQRPRAADESSNGAAPYDNRRDYELVRVASKTTALAGDTRWDFTAAWTYKDLDHPITPFAGVLDQVSNDLLLSGAFTHEGEILARDNRVRAGLMLTRGRTDAAAFENDFGSRAALRSRDEQTATNLELFAENQLALSGGFTAIVGANAAHSVRENRRLFTSPNPNPPFYTPPGPDAVLSYERDYDQFSPKLGLRWDNPTRDVQVFANVSRSFEPPSFSETVTANTARDAQTAMTFEAGTRGTRRFVRWDFAAYHADVRDELLTLTDPSTSVSSTTNADRTTHTGVELGADVDLLGQNWSDRADQRLVLRAAWTYGSFRFDDDPAYRNNRIAGLPPHIVRGELLWEAASGWYAGPTFEWVPVKSYVDHRNTLSADPYALLGAKVGRRLERGFSWFVEARNLTNTTYAATTGVIDNANGADRRQFLPGDGRSLYGGIEYRF